MQKKFDERRIANAVRNVESRSAAEIVVEIRSRSGSYAHAEARFAALLVLFSLIALVFMPWTVPPIAVPFDAVLFWLVGLAIVRSVPALRRLCATRRERLEAVRTHASAQFYARGIADTSGETGLLLYVSLLERRMEVVADRGVLRAVNAGDWNAALEAIHALPVTSIEDAVRSLGAVLERDLPAGAENVDELTNEVRES